MQAETGRSGRAPTWLGLAAALVAVAALVALVVSIQEPRHEGLTASQWFQDADVNAEDLADYGAIFTGWGEAGRDFLCRRLLQPVELTGWRLKLAELNNEYGTKVGFRPVPTASTHQERLLARRLLAYFGGEAAPDIALLLDKRPAGDRVDLIRAAVELGPEAGGVLGPRLVALLGDPDEGVVAEAITALAVLRHDPDRVVPLIVPMLAHGSTRVRTEASYALGSYPPAPGLTLGPLTAALDDRTKVVRANAARALGAMGGRAEPAAGRLNELLREKPGLTTARAVEALAQILGPEVVEQCPRFSEAHRGHLEGRDDYNRLMALHASICLGWPSDGLMATCDALLKSRTNWFAYESVDVLAKVEPRPAWADDVYDTARRFPNGLVRAKADEATASRAGVEVDAPELAGAGR